MDRIDRQILAFLEMDGRLTITELARRVGLTVAPCQRRLRELESSGVIRGYRAEVNAAALGLGFDVLASVVMAREDSATVRALEEAVAAVPEVRLAERLFGEPDYLLRVSTADIESYQRLRDETLASLPGMQRLTSTIVMRTVVPQRALATIRAH
jgi:DNA-binding Lrp family transcriptional regulator